MSRYSPTVHPEYAPGFAEALASALTTGIAAHRQADQDQERDQDRAEQSRQRSIQATSEGWRPGTAPTTEDSLEPRDDMFTLPQNLRSLPTSGAELARHLDPSESTPNGLNLSMFGGRSPASPFASSLDGAAATEPPPPTPHPGAFDPATGSFASMTRTVQRPVAPGRYIPVASGGYVDMNETPRADAREARETQLRLASELRGEELGQKGKQASDLEDQKQNGRQSRQDSINNNQLVNTTLRALLAGQNQSAHDDRTAKSGAAHDARVSNRVTINGGGKQNESNLQRAGAAIVEATNGSYDAAVDWLKNTPQGQAAAAHGLREDHLYAGLGSYNKNQQQMSVSLQKGVTGMDTPEAEQVRKGTRASVAPPEPPAAGEPTGMSGIRGGAGASKAVTPSTSDKGQDINLDDGDAEKWIAKNPRKAGETVEQWRARYTAEKNKKR